jgi:putative proteasome-type protease
LAQDQEHKLFLVYPQGNWTEMGQGTPHQIIGAAGVDFPIDVVLYKNGGYRVIEHRYERGDLQYASSWWQERLRASVNELPDELNRHFSV